MAGISRKFVSGGEHGAKGGISTLLKDLITGLPPVTDLAKAAGIELPPVLGRVQTEVSTASFTQPSAPAPQPGK